MNFKIYYNKDTEKTVVETDHFKLESSHVICRVTTISVHQEEHPKMFMEGTARNVLLREKSIFIE